MWEAMVPLQTTPCGQHTLTPGCQSRWGQNGRLRCRAAPAGPPCPRCAPCQPPPSRAAGRSWPRLQDRAGHGSPAAASRIQRGWLGASGTAATHCPKPGVSSQTSPRPVYPSPNTNSLPGCSLAAAAAPTRGRWKPPQPAATVTLRRGPAAGRLPAAAQALIRSVRFSCLLLKRLWSGWQPRERDSEAAWVAPWRQEAVERPWHSR